MNLVVSIVMDVVYFVKFIKLSMLVLKKIFFFITMINSDCYKVLLTRFIL